MKIAWFTPIAKDTGVSKYSHSVLNELIKKCEVDIWVSSAEENPLFTGLKIYYYNSNDDLSDKLKGYDFIIYNIGNNLFHADIYEVLCKIKGIAILHDFIMHHFLVTYYYRKGNTDPYVSFMEKFYGSAGRDIALTSLQFKGIPIWETDEVIKYPLFEKILEGALGVITHSRFHADMVKQKFLGPVCMLPLPFYPHNYSTTPANLRKIDLGIPEDKILIITVGDITPYKRIDKVINVLAKHKDIAKKVIYVIIGPNHGHSQYYSKLQSLIEGFNLNNTIRFLGYQPDEVLYAYLANADIVINLRYPTTEGASWSLIEQMYFGKAIVVNNTGFYGEMPDDCVVKIDVDEKEQLNLYNALTKLIDDEIERRNIGIRAKQFASENFTPQKYCQKFIGFLKKIKGSIPITNLIDKISLELSMMGVLYDSPIVDIISKEIYEILPKSSEGR